MIEFEKENHDKAEPEGIPNKLPDEILKTPGPDFIPPWKRDSVPIPPEKRDTSSVPPWKKNDLPLQERDLATRNKSMEGQKHPETGVPYEKKPIKNKNGELDEGVFPVFDSKFDAQLPEDLYLASDPDQFKECNEQLKEAVENDPELAEKFTPEQLEQIKNGDKPDGYTWHHNEEAGKMQLVDSETHAKTAHTGGRAIWGGGQENR